MGSSLGRSLQNQRPALTGRLRQTHGLTSMAAVHGALHVRRVLFDLPVCQPMYSCRLLV